MQKKKILLTGKHFDSTTEQTNRLKEFIHYFFSRGDEIHVAAVHVPRSLALNKDIQFHQLVKGEFCLDVQIQLLKKIHHFDLSVGFGELQKQDHLVLTNIHLLLNNPGIEFKKIIVSCESQRSTILSEIPMDPEKIIVGFASSEDEFRIKAGETNIALAMDESEEKQFEKLDQIFSQGFND